MTIAKQFLESLNSVQYGKPPAKLINESAKLSAARANSINEAAGDTVDPNGKEVKVGSIVEYPGKDGKPAKGKVTKINKSGKFFDVVVDGVEQPNHLIKVVNESNEGDEDDGEEEGEGEEGEVVSEASGKAGYLLYYARPTKVEYDGNFTEFKAGQVISGPFPNWDKSDAMAEKASYDKSSRENLRIGYGTVDKNGLYNEMESPTYESATPKSKTAEFSESLNQMVKRVDRDLGYSYADLAKKHNLITQFVHKKFGEFKANEENILVKGNFIVTPKGDVYYPLVSKDGTRGAKFSSDLDWFQVDKVTPPDKVERREKPEPSGEILSFKAPKGEVKDATDYKSFGLSELVVGPFTGVVALNRVGDVWVHRY